MTVNDKILDLNGTYSMDEESVPMSKFSISPEYLYGIQLKKVDVLGSKTNGTKLKLYYIINNCLKSTCMKLNIINSDVKTGLLNAVTKNSVEICFLNLGYIHIVLEATA